jgi:hypothetical protein
VQTGQCHENSVCGWDSVTRRVCADGIVSREQCVQKGRCHENSVCRREMGKWHKHAPFPRTVSGKLPASLSGSVSK